MTISCKWTLRYPALAAALLCLVLGDGSNPAAQHPLRDWQGQNPLHPPRRWFQFGRASWYGDQFQGQPTASGEAFDENQLTCAHRSLPLGSLVLVTNLRNHRSVIVRVNDRGPALAGRIVDLSRAAARLLGFRGLTRVRLDLIDASPSAAELALATMPSQVPAY